MSATISTEKPGNPTKSQGKSGFSRKFPAFPKRSERIIAFIEKLKVPSGIGQGEHLLLEDWQKDLIRETYDKVDGNNIRTIRRALWSMARKNGKTALAAALVLVHLIGPESKINGEIYSCASDRNQASNIYKAASQMVKLDPELSELCKCLDSVKRIVCYVNGSFYQSLAADSRRLHGFIPHFVIYDELAQAKNRELYDVMATSFGAQEECMFLTISTQSPDPDHVMSELVDEALAQERGEIEDETFYGKVFYVPHTLDWKDEKNWPLANPALGKFKSTKHMQALVSKAKRSPSAEAAFRALELNQRVDSVAGLVSSVDWRKCQGKPDDFSMEELRQYPLYCALDLSGRQDLTAFAMAWDMGGAVKAKVFFWTPKDELAERSRRDGAKYPEWERRGFLRATPGRIVGYNFVVQEISALIAGQRLMSMAYDRWHIDQFKAEIERAGSKPEDWLLHPFGQGYKDMSPAVEKLELSVVGGNLIHDGNPVLTYCMGNVMIRNDEAGNRKFDKRKKNRRIDGAVALAMSLHTIDVAEKVEKEGPSVYEGRGLLIL